MYVAVCRFYQSYIPLAVQERFSGLSAGGLATPASSYKVNIAPETGLTALSSVFDI